MTRINQSEEVRQKVLAAARFLFIERGYEAATIRQISAAAQVSSGSIYHFFADKEGVFMHLALHVFETAMQAAEARTAEHLDPYLSLALKWTYLVRLVSYDKRVAELFSIAYRSPKISRELLNAATLKHQAVLRSTLSDWSEEQFFTSTLVLGGVLFALVDERLNIERLTEATRIRVLLAAALPAFGLDPRNVAPLIQKAGALLPAFPPESESSG